MMMTLSQAVKATDAELVGDDIQFASVSTDTRNIKQGDLFVALSGEHFDAHDFVDQAIAQGATALMVSKPVQSHVPVLQVKDTRKGLGDLAHAWRKMVNPKVVALTGSNGKTTLKEMLAHIFACEYSVLATTGNLNNDIGVPLTLLRLQDEQIAVIEMGANHLGEIDYLTNIVKPDVAILNNAGLAHIGEFGSAENIARGKAEIINGLSADGVFVFHGDSQWVEIWQSLAKDNRVVSFGLKENDYRLLKESIHLQKTQTGFVSQFDVYERSSGESFTFQLQLAGIHNAMNACAAIAAARQFNLPMSVIKTGLAQMLPVKGRLFSLRGSKGQYLIDDTYNANPDSVKAAMDVLAELDGRRFMIMGDLAELGDDVKDMHAELGRYAAEKGLDGFYAVGQYSAAAVEGFVGQPAKHFDDQQALIDFLQNHTNADDSLLIKGSRSAKMENVVNALAGQEKQIC